MRDGVDSMGYVGKRARDPARNRQHHGGDHGNGRQPYARSDVDRVVFANDGYQRGGEIRYRRNGGERQEDCPTQPFDDRKPPHVSSRALQ